MLTQKDLNGKSILITGGTGSFGKAFTRQVLKDFPKIKRLVIFSRDEQKHFQMGQEFPHSEYKMMRYFIGDVRDKERLTTAMEGIDIVIHAAAMKHVPIAEYNPMECVKTNILGAQNVIDAALENGVTDVVALSTDKAAAPVNLYGATKLASDKLFIAANNIKGSRNVKFSAVRYGNVMGSNGSVMPFFMKKKKEGVLPITDPQMTRFNITLDEGVQLVRYAIDNAWGGEIFVPKIPSYVITDVAKAIAPECKTEVIGIRAGEKLHEEMITNSDSLNTLDVGKYFVILPQIPNFDLNNFKKHFNTKDVPKGFSYNSKDNDEWIGVEELKSLIADEKIAY
jgi:UDP-N-acetylglucosamine 4,6-dehydratase (inverting)